MNNTLETVRAGLAHRRRRETRFRWYGRIAIFVSLAFLALLLTSIFARGYKAFWQTEIAVDVHLDPGELVPPTPEHLAQADLTGLVKRALREAFPAVKSRRQKRALYRLVSSAAPYQLRDYVLAHPQAIGRTVRLWLLAGADVDMYMKGYFDASAPESERRLKDYQIAWLERLKRENRLRLRFNRWFFLNGDSREPEQAGIQVALRGSIYMMLVTFALSFPLGIAAAVYLEEFAPRNNVWVDLIEININNLAAVPSIVFGLLGLAVFLGWFGLPRSTPLVGGLTLTLMTLPTVIIASRAALKAVPPSIRYAALGIGASPVQTVFHHVLPLALPGMLTGAIIGMARALGETAPLLMIGMVAFIVDPPRGLLDPATALPVQIYLWADSPERGFVERTSAAIVILLVFLGIMNLAAILLRKRLERRW
ncbi:phosphate transport system permease protein [Methylomarinovum tepidoasis]|uniref:Phosphate transport system permease protein PstA n=1 Tax=Methylomarinovum tepidoasis TaxID=2840183 RepID=A0AAU9CB98_9GAMM|nr:phosphate ABC transporter permease PstA [Methylomarinovum sp. IN45]BCX87946.1 phosphate transport system permease protein [Methylomarinovum sp. IN45]